SSGEGDGKSRNVRRFGVTALVTHDNVHIIFLRVVALEYHARIHTQRTFEERTARACEPDSNPIGTGYERPPGIIKRQRILTAQTSRNHAPEIWKRHAQCFGLRGRHNHACAM